MTDIATVLGMYIMAFMLEIVIWGMSYLAEIDRDDAVVFVILANTMIIGTYFVFKLVVGW